MRPEAELIYSLTFWLVILQRLQIPLLDYMVDWLDWLWTGWGVASSGEGRKYLLYTAL